MSLKSCLSLTAYYFCCLVLSNLFSVWSHLELRPELLHAVNVPQPVETVIRIGIGAFIPFMFLVLSLFLIKHYNLHLSVKRRTLLIASSGAGVTFISSLFLGYSIVHLSMNTICVFAGSAGSVLDEFAFLRKKIDSLKVDDPLELKGVFLGEVNKFFFDTSAAFLSIGAVIGVCMSILWPLDQPTAPALRKDILSAYMIVSYSALGVAVYFWTLRPLLISKRILYDKILDRS